MSGPHPRKDGASATMKSPACGSRLFYCEVCGKGFKSFKACRQHKNEVHGVKNYACPVEECSYSTTNKCHLQRHMRTHTGEKPFACNVVDCGKAFAHRGDLQRHARAVHELSRPFLCQLCAYSCSNAQGIIKHVKAVHEKVKEWRCEMCSKQFSQKCDLTRHTANVHEKASRFRCAKCDKGFYQRQDLKAHELTHLEEAKFKCNECGGQFSYKQSLMAHVKRIHGNLPRPKKHRCDVCEYAATDKTKLELHVRARHKKERPFQCTDCSQSFAYKQDFRKHVQVHGAQTFKCTQCDRKYRHQDSLRLHVALHGKKLQCESCNYATPKMSNLKRHILRQHKDELRQTIVAAHTEAPCSTPDGEVTASKGNIWKKYEHAPEIIGQGDFGSVFKARLRSTQETVHGYRYAIKCVDLTTRELEAEAHLLKCRREVQLIHDCRHENVIAVYEFFEFYYENEPDKFYMVMELGSESLALVRKNTDLTSIHCIFIFAKVAAALKHIHDLGIVHRDVKPDNVMICFDGVPKLCDFGESTRLREDGTCIGHAGSPMYMAPDMGTAAEPTAYGPKADTFSFGISAAEVSAQGTFNLIRTNETNTLNVIRDRIRSMSIAYQELVRACVAFDPSKRPSSSEVYDALENGLAKDLNASCLENIVANFIH